MGERAVTEQKMIGGLAFLIAGNMALALAVESTVILQTNVGAPIWFFERALP